MNINDTDTQQIDLFELISAPAIHRMIRTLATVKNYRKTAAMKAAIQAKHAKAFHDAWSFLRSECCENDNKNGVLLQEEYDVTAKDPVVEQDNE